MKPKYILERFKTYFVFGTSLNGKVDLNDGTEDICHVTPLEASKIIKDRDEILALVLMFNDKFPAQFEECFKNI